jgi:HEAT repeat protein
MPKASRLEDALAELHLLRDNPTADSALAKLRAALGGKSSHAAAKAADIAGEFEIGALTPDLVAAFARFMINPVKTDPGCRAKTAIADALYRIGHEDEAIFLQGIRYVQMEPVYGGRADTAGDLRAASALGLVRMNHRDALVELADLLADPEVPVRIAAARTIAYSENEQAAPMLRLKVLVGDHEPQVIAECLGALLKVAPASSLPFAARLLDSPDASMQEAAALALGGSRLREAFDILKAWWERNANAELRRTALLAIAMVKQDAAIAFLLSLVAEGIGPTARDAIAALGVYRHDDALRARVVRAAQRADGIDLSDAIAKTF